MTLASILNGSTEVLRIFEPPLRGLVTSFPNDLRAQHMGRISVWAEGTPPHPSTRSHTSLCELGQLMAAGAQASMEQARGLLTLRFLDFVCWAFKVSDL